MTDETLPPTRWSAVQHDGATWWRATCRTRWLDASDDLAGTLVEVTDGRLRAGDTVCVSEKVAVLLTGRAVPAGAVRPGRLARLLAGQVRPVGASRGLTIPEKMQYVLHSVGAGRVVAAAAVAALTRPLGWRGVFYRLAGSVARDLDGMRPPYEGLLLPPLGADTARDLAIALSGVLGAPVAIVDINDRGGSVRGTSAGAVGAGTLQRVLADNPAGQRVASTPFVIVRPPASQRHHPPHHDPWHGDPSHRGPAHPDAVRLRVGQRRRPARLSADLSSATSGPRSAASTTV